MSSSYFKGSNYAAGIDYVDLNQLSERWNLGVPHSFELGVQKSTFLLSAAIKVLNLGPAESKVV